MKTFLVIACLFIATAFAEDGKDKCVSGYDQCVKSTGTDSFSRLKCGIEYLKCRFNGMMEQDDELSFQADDSKKSCFDDVQKCLAAESVDKKFACFKQIKECVAGKIKEKVGETKTKLECLKKCKNSVSECLAKGGKKLECLKKVGSCTKACFKKDDADQFLFMDDAGSDPSDKCVSVYDQCVNGTGTDAFSRLKCGVEYLKCRFNGMMEQDDELSFQADDSKKSCIVDAKKCMTSDSSEKETCIKQLKECVAGKINDKKEKVKAKIECIKKCKEVGMKCYKDSKSSDEKKQCAKDGYACLKKCFA